MTTGGQWPPSGFDENPSRWPQQPNPSQTGQQPAVPDPGQTGQQPADPSDPPANRPGSISFQDPATTVAREPTLAEQRARERAAQEQAANEAAWWDEQQKRAKRRKRILIGGAVGIGVVAVIALSYSSSHPDSTEARCVGPDNVVVPDSNCVTPAAQGSYYGGGGGYLPYPIFIGGGGRQYHYTYGGSGNPGQVATGGTTVQPRGTVTTDSGRTINPSRSDYGGSSSGSGGFGSSTSAGSGSSSGSGESAGSGSIRRGGFGVSSRGSSGS